MGRLKYLVKTPKYEYLPDGLPTGYVFSMFMPKYPEFVAVPMESGKTGLYRLVDIYTPTDPGDMHLPEWEFIKYIKRATTK